MRRFADRFALFVVEHNASRMDERVGIILDLGRGMERKSRQRRRRKRCQIGTQTDRNFVRLRKRIPLEARVNLPDRIAHKNASRNVEFESRCRSIGDAEMDIIAKLPIKPRDRREFIPHLDMAFAILRLRRKIDDDIGHDIGNDVHANADTHAFPNPNPERRIERKTPSIVAQMQDHDVVLRRIVDRIEGIMRQMHIDAEKEPVAPVANRQRHRRPKLIRHIRR